MNIHLASQILRGNWLINREFAHGAGVIVSGVLEKGLALNHPADQFNCFAVESGRSVKYNYRFGWDGAPVNSTAVIPVKGVLMKNSQECGPIGMAEIGNRIKEADTNPNITRIIFDIDSPGGTVDGTETLGIIIKECKTETIAFVNGLCASAALWLASCCDKRVASTGHDNIGSVGVILSFVDVQPYYEKLGIKFHTIRSEQSPDKNADSEKLSKGDYTEYQKNVLNPLADLFISVVKQGCPNATDEHLTGKMFFAKNVLGVFVDEIKSFDALVNDEDFSREVTTESNDDSDDTENVSSQTDNNNSNSSLNMKDYTNINAVLGLESLESVDGSISLNAEQMEAINTALGANSTAATALETERTAHGATSEQLTQANAQIEVLKKGAGASSNDLSKESDSAKADKSDFLAQDDVQLFNNL